MALAHSPRLVTDGLVLCLDAGNTKSYSGSGTTWTDLGGNNNHGTLVNGVGYNSSNGGSLTFDGADDYVDLSTTYSLSAPWTLSAWIYPTFNSSVRSNSIFYAASNPRTFSFYYSSPFSVVLGVDIDSSNNVYINSSHVLNGKGGILKFNSSYQLDTNFDTDLNHIVQVTRPWTLKLSTYYSGKLYACFDEYSGNNQQGLRRYNSDGSLDTSFNSGGAGFNIQVHDFEEDSNGRLYVAGRFTEYNGTSVNRIVRLNTDGSIDTNFSIGSGFDSIIYNLEWDSTNSKLYVFGDFTSYNGTSINRIVRLNTDGSIDTSFNVGTGFNSFSYISKLDSNGKLYVGGFFTSYNGTGANRIIRLNSDGSIDTGFSYGTGINSGYVSHIEIDSSGKIFVCGSSFSSYNGTTANDIVKLNTDGSIDTSFSTGTGFNNQVRNLKEDSNGKLIVLGGFTDYNGTSVSRAILLNADGTLNTDILSSFENRAALQNFYTDFDTYSVLDLQLAGVSSEKIISESTFYSIFDGTTPIQIVESMSSSGTYRYYMNGVLLKENENTPTTGVNIQGLMRGISSVYWFKGKVSNIGIYNRDLSTQEVKQNFNALRGRFGI